MLNESLHGGSSRVPFRKGRVRFLFLLLVVLVAFGNEYAFNNPQALEETIYKHLKISET
jgi:MFS family permease